jgi:hypothetical protein
VVVRVKQFIEISKFLRKKVLLLSSELFGLILFTKIELIKILDIITTFSMKNPHLGQAQVSAQIKANYDIEISPSGVRHIWLREEMNTTALRIQKAKL